MVLAGPRREILLSDPIDGGVEVVSCPGAMAEGEGLQVGEEEEEDDEHGFPVAVGSETARGFHVEITQVDSASAGG